jgi:hypothetical protein
MSDQPPTSSPAPQRPTPDETPTSNVNAAASVVRLATFGDLTADLVWPKLLRAGPLALAPTRIVLSWGYVLGAAALMWLSGLIERLATGSPRPSPVREMFGLIGADLLSAFSMWARPQAAAGHVMDAFVITPVTYVRDHPWAVVLPLPVLAVWTALMGGAVCRSAASEYALGRAISWSEALGFAARSLGSLVAAVLGPVVIAWVMFVGLAIAGLAFRVPVLDVLAAVLFGLALVAGVIGAVVLMVWTLGGAMLAPAVACESADAVDAVQRTYAYVLGKPLRLLVYIAVLVAQAVVFVAITATVGFLAIKFATNGAASFAADRGASALGAAAATSGTGGLWDTLRGGLMIERGLGTSGIARVVVGVWGVLLLSVLGALVVSLFWSSATLLYLAMRRVVDGQDMHELWSSGMVGGTMAQSLASRAQAARDARTSAPDAVGDADEN